MKDFTVRPWQDGDDLALLEIWHDADNSTNEAFRASITADSDAQPWSRTLVVEHLGIPVAAGTIYETSLHHRHLWSYLEVAAEHRRQGVGTLLLNKLRELAKSSPSGVHTLRTKVEPGSAGEAFAQVHGLENLQRSRLVRIEAGAIPLVPLHEDEDGRAHQAIEDLATGSIELTQKLWDFYVRSHAWDPPAETPLPRVNRLFLSDEAEAFGAIVLRDDIIAAKKQGKKGDIKAFAVSYRPLQADVPGAEIAEGSATEILLGYDYDFVGVREAIVQVLSLLAYQYPVTVEVDDSMEDLAVLIDHFVKSGAASVVTETMVVAEPSLKAL
ncbi:GNAT family N-acetyltransferase [Rothia sp. ZJ1223]|uniref:GNAT family N-acetyltransferase n=1 Tax=Rothia sp. ZJ1223 TaxID=2811098 RepID=UPI001958CC71|nr:GNAT family N-acetyltransferase [Rothia sp. ZJ1223]MBM7051347.1 GNAT family N-acetyltransferase [Rothia sp. ZJ1223]